MSIAVVLFGDPVIAKASKVRANLAVGPTGQHCGALGSSHCECTLKFCAAAQNRLDFWAM
jgi:hypothetical protein